MIIVGMHTLIVNGTTGPIYEVVLRVIGDWIGGIEVRYALIPHLLQLVPARDGLHVLTDSLPLARYIEDRLRSGCHKDTGAVDSHAAVWGKKDAVGLNYPSSIDVHFV